jgi:hypothetical protein
MEKLVADLKDRLIDRRIGELQLIDQYKEQRNDNLILITSGKIFELDYLIGCLTDLMDYNSKCKRIKEGLI